LERGALRCVRAAAPLKLRGSIGQRLQFVSPLRSRSGPIEAEREQRLADALIALRCVRAAAPLKRWSLSAPFQGTLAYAQAVVPAARQLGGHSSVRVGWSVQ